MEKKPTPPKDLLTLGQFIIRRRENLGYKKVAFSKMIGVGDDTLRKWERDLFVPAGKNMYALVKELKMTRDEVHTYFRNDYHANG